MIKVRGQYTKEEYTIFQYQSDTVSCWTYQDSHGQGPGLCPVYRQCETINEVNHQIQNDDAIRRVEGNPLTRAEYETECAELGFVAIPDSEIDSYGTRFGQFHWIDYPLHRCMMERLNFRRLLGMSSEQKEDNAPIKRPPIRKRGQLFERCSRCGREPVYLPLHLCERCWPED